MSNVTRISEEPGYKIDLSGPKLEPVLPKQNRSNPDKREIWV